MSAYELTAYLCVLVSPMLIVPAVPHVAAALKRRFIDPRAAAAEAAAHDLLAPQVAGVRFVMLAAACAGTSGVALGALAGSVLVGVVAFALVFRMQSWYWENRRTERRRQFERQLPALVDQLAASARAGLNLPQCIRTASTNIPSPGGVEMAVISRMLESGGNLEVALERSLARLGSRLYDLLGLVLIINQRKGGNVSEALGRVADALRQIAQIEEKYWTASTQARTALKWLFMMPLIPILLANLLAPDLVSAVVDTVQGKLLLVVVGLLFAAAMAWLRSLLQADL